ncbi:MAG TPA: hypothetical protein VMT54_08595, partial [Candidatus Cybelea sp.]|nr:hypothetical protein [Candidatus Cybelea sp.]
MGEIDIVVIKLEAFPFTRYGTVPAKIKTVSEDAISGSTNRMSQQESGAAPSEAQSAKDGLYFSSRITLDRT